MLKTPSDWAYSDNRCAKSEFGYAASYLDFNGVQNLALDLPGQELFLDYYDEAGSAEHVIDV